MKFAKKYPLPYVVLFLSLLILTFMATTDSMEIFSPPIVWFYPATPVKLIFPIYIFAAIITFAKRSDFDGISVSLTLRGLICLIPILYISNTDSFSAHYPVVIITFCSYFIFKNNATNNLKLFFNIIILFSIIWSIQVIYTSYFCGVSYWDLLYKNEIRIPIAASNVIAAYISPAIILLLLTDYVKLSVKTILTLVLLMGLILTKSRGGLLSFLLCYMLYFCFVKLKMNWIKFSIFVLLAIVAFLYIENIPEVKAFLFASKVDEDSVNANSFSSGRLDLFDSEFHRFLNHPLFGNGMVFTQNNPSSGSHNMLIELLVQSGLIGMIFYMFPIIYVFKKLYKIINEKNLSAWFFFLGAHILEGMIEVTFFNYTTDIIFWSAVGLLLSYIKSIEQPHYRILKISC